MVTVLGSAASNVYIIVMMKQLNIVSIPNCHILVIRGDTEMVCLREGCEKAETLIFPKKRSMDNGSDW